jgi:hypothetical protein
MTQLPIEHLLPPEEMKRLILEIAALDVPPSSQAMRLTRSKADLPKLLALDMNAWIYLARAAYGQANHPDHVAALDAIRNATALGKLVAPVFPMNLTEVGDVSRDDRRARLAAFMVDLSRNHSIMYSAPLRERELYDAVQSVYLGNPIRNDARARMLCWGIGPAVGIGGVRLVPKSGGDAPVVAQLLLDEVLAHPRISTIALSSIFSKEGTAAARQLDERCAEVLAYAQSGCADLTSDERLAAETWNLAEQGTVRGEIDRVLGRSGVPAVPFFDWLKEDSNRIRFFNAVPILRVQSALMLARDRNLDNVPHRNDMKDLFFLGVALPYANFVITEKAWGHIAKSSKIAAHFGTHVVSLSELPQRLAQEGCLSS